MYYNQDPELWMLAAHEWARGRPLAKLHIISWNSVE